MDREVRIKLIAEGASRAAADVRGVSDAVGQLGGVAGKTSAMLADVGKAAFRMASDAAKAANDVKPISFAAAADSAKKFDDSVTRLAVRANRDIGSLKQQFRETGKEIGVLPDRLAQAARALTKMTGSADAADAMKALGIEANDTDRSIEEMAEVGAALYNKLGVPMDKIGDAIKRVRGVAADFQTVGGHVALEDTLVRLAPLLARFQGSVGRAAATISVLSRGKSKEVGERTSESILSAFAGADPLLVTKKLREITRDKNYQPYATNDQGEDVLKSDAMVKLQQHFRKLPFGAVLRFFGNNITAARTFMSSNSRLEDVDEAEKRTEATRRTLLGEGGAFDLGNLRPSDRASIDEYNRRIMGGEAPPSGLAATTAGERARTDAERADVELSAGDIVQGQRDKRNRMYRGQRAQQAGIDTVKAYLPSSLERGAEIAEAIAAENASRVAGPGGSRSRVDRLTVDLSSQSIKGVADAIRSSPPIVRTGSGPAAQAVEAAKAHGKAAANF